MYMQKKSLDLCYAIRKFIIAILLLTCYYDSFMFTSELQFSIMNCFKIRWNETQERVYRVSVVPRIAYGLIGFYFATGKCIEIQNFNFIVGHLVLIYLAIN